jgi:uncharacterized protein (DUF433 family)
MARKENIIMGEFTRITQNPAVRGGKPYIRGMRAAVGMIVAQIGASYAAAAASTTGCNTKSYMTV